jgi:gamma-glutamyltranspeptidase/glutathione hydrolase
VARHRVFNLPPPTQGLASLMLLGVFDRLRVAEAETFEYVHALVEATKCAFRVRDAYVTDPAFMARAPAELLAPSRLDALAADVNPRRAAPWPGPSSAGDTVWLAAADRKGRVVSFIQSIYFEFGSGVVLPGSGIVWQNRGTSFSLDTGHHNRLDPGRRPFHTIQPALARLADGRVMAYGTMGGEGQPQTQALVFSRHVLYRQGLQQAVTAPRFVLGRTWGEAITRLRIERRFDARLIERLRGAGHDVQIVVAFSDEMGHAGALVRHPDGLLEGAADPRSDGQAAGR